MTDDFKDRLDAQRQKKAVPSASLPHHGVGVAIDKHEKEEVARRKNSGWAQESGPPAPGSDPPRTRESSERDRGPSY